MEELVTLLVPAFFAVILARLLLTPMKLALKVALHAACGFGCLWILNAVSEFTGIAFPINAVTVLTAGFLGIPGIGLMALLAVM